MWISGVAYVFNGDILGSIFVPTYTGRVAFADTLLDMWTQGRRIASKYCVV